MTTNKGSLREKFNAWLFEEEGGLERVMEATQQQAAGPDVDELTPAEIRWAQEEREEEERIAASMNNFALGRLQVTTVTAFGGISTFVTIAIGCLVGKERLYGFHLVGLALILIRMIGVSWISIRSEQKKSVVVGKK